MSQRRELAQGQEDTLGLEDAAKVLRLGLEAMKALVEEGTVPAVRLNQKHTVMLREDLIEFLRAEGRRQAAERKAAIGKRPAANSAQLSPQRAKPAKARRISPPDLAAYEVKG
ncbi:hypothetical protein ABE522_06075 [Stenotrophomonas pennii]|uniref:hypothetical protein n=1 Tax=Stenotrophomonas lacuserhaii TaxID=2760084 RepID=UPI00320A53CE